jgi:hypothetical protein
MAKRQPQFLSNPVTAQETAVLVRVLRMCCCAHLTLKLCREKQEAAACHLLPIPILSSFLSGLGCLLSDPSVLPCTHACSLHEAQQTHWQQPSLYLSALQEWLMFPCLPGHCCPQPSQCLLPWSHSASCCGKRAPRCQSWCIMAPFLQVVQTFM